jgi:hypothetical protein
MNSECELLPLLSQLDDLGVELSSKDGKVMVKLPWSPSQMPDTAKELLQRIKQVDQVTLITFITLIKKPTNEPATVGGNMIALHKMRDTCRAAGHCLSLTTETDCNLYPVRLGRCRERVQALRQAGSFKTTGKRR